MDNLEEIKKAVQQEVESLKSHLGSFATKEDMTRTVDAFKQDMQKQYGDKNEELVKSLGDLDAAVKAQGELLQSIKNQSPKAEKTFKELLEEQKSEMLDAIDKGVRHQIFTTRKAVISSNVVDGTLGYRDNQVGQIQRGIPYMRDLFPVVSMGTNTQNTARWFEQTAVTNNATATGENRARGSQSNITWAEKTLNGRRIVDIIKVGRDQIKDVDFVLGEVQQLILRNMRLKENDALINGDGTGNNINGLLTYATAFDATGKNIVNPNLMDLAGLCITQIDADMKGGAMPNYFVANRKDTDGVRFAKTTDGAYCFPQLITAPSISLAGVSTVENPLVAADTLICGDFNLGTIFVWDDLVVEMYEESTDRTDGLVTIGAYMRENLRVKEVDKKAFVYVSSIADALTAIDSNTIEQHA